MYMYMYMFIRVILKLWTFIQINASFQIGKHRIQSCYKNKVHSVVCTLLLLSVFLETKVNEFQN